MNQTIESMLQHTSVRTFESTPLDTNTITALLRAAQAGSTSNAVQAYSILHITNPSLRQELGDISGCAPYVINSGGFFMFVADLYRHATMLTAANQSLDGIRTMESLTVAIVDATIAAQNFCVAAESLGLGICYIGGIRNDIRRVASLLQLPKYTFPLYGITVGTPLHTNEVKPRLPLHNLVCENTYDTTAFTDMHAYDAITRDYYSHRESHPSNTDFTEKMVDFFSTIRRPDIGAFLMDQGFLLK